jgi:D-3-phosphoglycerate dehydrogenase
MKVYVLDEMHPEGLNWLQERTELVRWDDPKRSVWYEEAVGVMVRTVKVPAVEMQQARQLKAISKLGVGVNNIDLNLAKSLGLTVCNTPGINKVAVAEMALTLVASLARRVPQFDRLIRAGSSFNRNEYPGIELNGKTLGIVGMGNIGSEFARIMKAAFSCRILAFDPWADASKWSGLEHVRVTQLDEMWSNADVVSLHVPYNAQNHHMVNADVLALMKPGALLINVSRGGLIDEAALYQFLKAGHLGGAALDVWQDKEPPAADHPLLTLPNVIATPHVAGSTDETLAKSSLAAAQQLWQVLQGGEPFHRVV